MDSIRCRQTTGTVLHRSRAPDRKKAACSFRADLFSSRTVRLRQTSTASRPLQATSGPSGSPFSGYDGDREQDKRQNADSNELLERGTRESASEQAEQILSRDEEEQQTGDVGRPQGGNGIAPGLASGKGLQPQAGMPPAGELRPKSENQEVFRIPGRGGTGPSEIPPPLGMLPLQTSFPKTRPTSSMISDFSDEEVEPNRAGSSSGWVGQPSRMVPDSPWNPTGIPLPTPGRSPSKGGLPKGMNLGLRGRQSVLGNATMQGSRFEVGAGDTSWINSMSPDWFPVIPLWQATEKAAMASEPFLSHMSQGWRVLLLSDGSVIRHLHLLTGHRVSVDCLEMRPIGHSLLGVPPGTALVAGPRVQRQVLLKTREGTPLVYAASWWAEYEAKQHLQETHTSIWAQLQDQRMELFRSLECIYYGHTRELEKLFGRDGPFWARHYLFYHNGRPLTLIYEVFSPALDEWLGDSALPEDLYLP